jgi:hypothetical protein
MGSSRKLFLCLAVAAFMLPHSARAADPVAGLHINGSIDYTGTITDGNRYSQPPAQGTP